MNRPIDIAKCSVCGSYHRDMMTYPLEPHVVVDKLTYVRYGICPESKRTIYLAYDRRFLVNIPAPSINFPKEVKVSMEQTYIFMPATDLEHLLNCLDNQKFLPLPDNQSEFEQVLQQCIDEFNVRLRTFLHSNTEQNV